jgi:hypothetical protein
MEQIIKEKYDISVDGKAVWDYIEKQVREHGLEGTQDVEVVLYKKEQKILFMIRVDVERGYDEKQDLGYTDIHYVDIL